MKVTVCQLDNRPGQLEAMLDGLAAHIADQHTEFLLLPEMCFHEWLAADNDPDRERWLAAVKSHASAILELGKLGAKAVIGTRPIINDIGSFRNQAYLWTAEPRILPVHEKYYLPNEDGYWEASTTGASSNLTCAMRSIPPSGCRYVPKCGFSNGRGILPPWGLNYYVSRGRRLTAACKNG